MSDRYFRIRFPQFLLHVKTPNTSHSSPRDFKQQFRGSLRSWCHVIRCRIRDKTADVHQHNFIQNNISSLPLPIMHYVEIPQGNHPLTSGLEAILRNCGSVSCPFSSRHIQLTYQFSQEVFRMDGSPYLESCRSNIKGYYEKK